MGMVCDLVGSVEITISTDRKNIVGKDDRKLDVSHSALVSAPGALLLGLVYLR